MFCISSLQALLGSAIDVLLLMSVDSREYFCYNLTVIHLILREVLLNVFVKGFVISSSLVVRQNRRVSFRAGQLS